MARKKSNKRSPSQARPADTMELNDLQAGRQESMDSHLTNILDAQMDNPDSALVQDMNKDIGDVEPEPAVTQDPSIKEPVPAEGEPVPPAEGEPVPPVDGEPAPPAEDNFLLDYKTEDEARERVEALRQYATESGQKVAVVAKAYQDALARIDEMERQTQGVPQQQQPQGQPQQAAMTREQFDDLMSRDPYQAIQVLANSAVQAGVQPVAERMMQGEQAFTSYAQRAQETQYVKDFAIAHPDADEPEMAQKIVSYLKSRGLSPSDGLQPAYTAVKLASALGMPFDPLTQYDVGKALNAVAQKSAEQARVTQPSSTPPLTEVSGQPAQAAPAPQKGVTAWDVVQSKVSQGEDPLRDRQLMENLAAELVDPETFKW